MSNPALARRYAKALLALAQDADAVEPTQRDLDELHRALAEGDGLDTLSNPGIPPRAKVAALDAIAQQTGMADLLHRFMRRLIDARRIDALGSICDAYRHLSREHLGVAQATVTAAQPMTDAQHRLLRQALESKTGKQVTMEVDVDPALLAGVRVRIGNQVLDGSAQAKLRRLRARITQETVHED